VVSPLELSALVTKILSPQMIGLDKAMPGIGVLNRRFSFLERSHVRGTPCPSPIPDAPGPRNCGQGFGSPRGTVLSAATGSPFLSGCGLVVTTLSPEMSP